VVDAIYKGVGMLIARIAWYVVRLFLLATILPGCGTTQSNNVNTALSTNTRLDTLFVIGADSSSENDLFFGMVLIDVDSLNRLWVIDTGNLEIKVYDDNGRRIRKWGGKGKGPGRFMYPTALNVCKDIAWTWDERNKSLCKWSIDKGLVEIITHRIGPTFAASITDGGELFVLQHMHKDVPAETIGAALLYINSIGVLVERWRTVIPATVAPNYVAVTPSYSLRMTPVGHGIVISKSYTYTLLQVTTDTLIEHRMPALEIPYSEEELALFRRQKFVYNNTTYKRKFTPHKPAIQALGSSAQGEVIVRTPEVNNTGYRRYDILDLIAGSELSMWLPPAYVQITKNRARIYAISRDDEGVITVVCALLLE